MKPRIMRQQLNLFTPPTPKEVALQWIRAFIAQQRQQPKETIKPNGIWNIK